MIRVIAMALAALLASSPAMAHAFLEKARPAAGSKMETAPQSVTLTFSESVEWRFSRIEVTDAQGGRVDEGDLATGRDGKTLVIKVNPSSPGRYVVVWHVTAVDTHKGEGRFEFTVGP